MKNIVLIIILLIGLLILRHFTPAEAASLPSSPTPFYPPVVTGPPPIPPPANPPSLPAKPAAPSGNGLERGITNPRTGEFYPGAIGGVINPRTGVFLPKVEGGYFNPETGDVVPKP